VDLFIVWTSQLTGSRQRPGIKPKLEALMNLYEGKKIIVGRDKLDVVKGVVQKVGGFDFIHHASFPDYFVW